MLLLGFAFFLLLAAPAKRNTAATGSTFSNNGHSKTQALWEEERSLRKDKRLAEQRRERTRRRSFVAAMYVDLFLAGKGKTASFLRRRHQRDFGR